MAGVGPGLSPFAIQPIKEEGKSTIDDNEQAPPSRHSPAANGPSTLSDINVPATLQLEFLRLSSDLRSVETTWGEAGADGQNGQSGVPVGGDAGRLAPTAWIAGGKMEYK
ncbi:hypothetical protein TESG_01693 [Trichophyton tonsurans CBS 112818]|uniref:Uncharacterized protein n=1 Tax=Trichophyton tonsurans (strain CBS 112818) TaxID=647933 RepID=F2RS69_TRIT1|nr:hypothetical protein TESG_01693 [Trichophyton tonsurans CBS 112818]